MVYVTTVQTLTGTVCHWCSLYLAVITRLFWYWPV